jgi:hypothetical protein
MRNHIAPTLTAILGGVLAYFGAYYATVDRVVFLHHGMWSSFPSYTIGGDSAAPFFEPAHVLDRAIRPLHWTSGTLPPDGKAPAELEEINFF